MVEGISLNQTAPLLWYITDDELGKDNKDIEYMSLRKGYTLESIESNIPDPMYTVFGTFMPKSQFKVIIYQYNLQNL